MVSSPFRFMPDEMEYIRDLAADELSKFDYHDGEPAEAARVVGEVLDRADEYLTAEPRPATTPQFEKRELAYIYGLLADEVAALDEMDDDERRDGSLETLGRALGRLVAYFNAGNRA